MRCSSRSAPGKDLLAGLWSAPFLLALLASGCEGDRGSSGEQGRQGTTAPTRTELTRHEDLPGVVVAITRIAPGSGPGGNLQAGDLLSVTFTVEKSDGTELPLGELDYGGILAAGPTSNYQPILARATDLRSASVENADGSYTYTFATPIPSTYLPPLNDSASFGLGDGELQGQPLLPGTYTVGIEAYKNYTVEGAGYRDAGNATSDFLLGIATALSHREVVKVENCNQCHVELRAHGAFRRDLTHCLLCHYTGAEDRNTSSAAGGTPGVTIDFKAMIHKIHNGAHLPSVLGVATNSNGTRDYSATPVPYKLVGNNNNVYDFSHVAFPVWPNLTNPMPRDTGYSGLTNDQKAQEDAIRGGAATCEKCHGDPDGSGPLAAPAQGGQAYSNPTRLACGSCHDDIAWTRPYTSNLLTMPAQADDSGCLACHPASGAVLGTRESHLHPLLDPAVNGGLVFNIISVTDAGSGTLNGKIDPGEKIQVEFTIKDGLGVDVAPATLARLSVVVAGPTTNSQLLLNMDNAFPKAALASSTVTTNLPEKIWIEFLGDAPAGSGQVLGTSVRAPHWNVTGGETVVQQRTATAGGDTTLALAGAAGQNYIDVDSASGFARGDYIVIDDGEAGEEYLRIQWVDGTRLWFSSPQGPYSQPNLRTAHSAGATVKEVALTTKTVATHYTLNAATGEITEVADNFADGAAVVVTYVTDFVMPSVYPATINDEPDQDETWGKWSGKAIVAGTYTVGIYGERTVTLNLAGETNSYAGTAQAAVKNFLVGSATAAVPYALVASGANCYACHDDLWFHGSHRRGLEACLLCHGLSGAGDRPRYVAPNAPATTGTVIDFRQMLHKIHMGKELANASTYGVVAFGSTAHPDNYSLATYSQVGFPAMIGGAKQCAVCHGAANTAWKAPSDRAHPTEQVASFRGWYVVCGSCHDSSAANVHFALMTGAGESCAVCHGLGKGENVELVHKSR